MEIVREGAACLEQEPEIVELALLHGALLRHAHKDVLGAHDVFSGIALQERVAVAVVLE